MFDQLKQIAKLKKIKESMEKEKKTIEKDGVLATVNGKMQIEEIKLNPELEIEKQEQLVKECINNAFLEIQKEIANKMF